MAHNMTASLAANVRAEAARYGISQVQIAEHLGRNQSAISRRMSGKTEFSPTELAKIADLFGVRVSKFYGERS